MREIKFRAWHKSRKEMLPIVDMEYLMTRGSLVTSYIDFVENISDNIMQFTGLRDKNKVEIYEGDIVVFKSWVGWEKSINRFEVFWHQQTCCFAIDDRLNNAIRNIPCSDYEIEQRQLEVIGNIYEHPHLLKDEKEENAD